MGGGMPGEEHAFSVELCGGTHVAQTGDIGLLKIVDEGAVSAGVRRIEALTGQAALDYMREREDWLDAAAAELRAAPADVPQRVRTLIEDRKKLEREIADLRRKLAAGGGDNAVKPVSINQMMLYNYSTKDMPPNELKSVVDEYLRKSPSTISVAASGNTDGKLVYVVGVAPEAKTYVNANSLVQLANSVFGGKGGGRDDLAQGGAPDKAGSINDLFKLIEKAVRDSV